MCVHEKKCGGTLQEVCSVYTSGSQEVQKDEHVHVGEVSDPSTANKDLPPSRRRMYRLNQVARGPAELRWTHNKIQRFFTGGQSLQDVAASLRQGAVQPSELPMIGIVGHEMKWYSRNSLWLWCFKAAKAEAVEVCMSSVDTASLHGLTTQTEGLSVTFFPPLQCKACHIEFGNRSIQLRWFQFGPAVRIANMSGGRRKSRIVIHTEPSLT